MHCGRCLGSPDTLTRIQADVSAAAACGVNATPGLFVNCRFVDGAISYGAMEARIGDELARDRAERAHVASRAD